MGMKSSRETGITVAESNSKNIPTNIAIRKILHRCALLCTAIASCTDHRRAQDLPNLPTVNYVFDLAYHGTLSGLQSNHYSTTSLFRSSKHLSSDVYILIERPLAEHIFTHFQ